MCSACMHSYFLQAVYLEAMDILIAWTADAGMYSERCWDMPAESWRMIRHPQ